MDLVAPEWAEFAVDQRRRKVEERQEMTRYQCVFLAKDGTRVPVEVTSTLVKENGRVVGIRAVVADLRRHVATERRLEESEERFRGVFDAAAIGMAMVAPDGRWLQVNDAMTRLLGFSKQELLERTWRDVTHPEDVPRDEEAKLDMLAGRVSWYHMEKRYIRSDGAVIWGMLAVSLVRDANGSPAYFLSQVNDITAAKAAEQRKLSALADIPGIRALSAREREVVSHLTDGLPSTDIAARLGIADQTVQTLVKRAMRKLGARNRAHLVATAMRLGIIS